MVVSLVARNTSEAMVARVVGCGGVYVWQTSVRFEVENGDDDDSVWFGAKQICLSTTKFRRKILSQSSGVKQK